MTWRLTIAGAAVTRELRCDASKAEYRVLASPTWLQLAAAQLHRQAATMKSRMIPAVTLLAFASTVVCLVGCSGRPVRVVDTLHPPYVIPTNRDYYPPQAKRQGITGRVGLECNVDARGRARDVVILESGGPLLDEGAKQLLYDGQFHIPDGWSASDGPTKRFRYGIIFRMNGKPEPAIYNDNRGLVVVTGAVE
jgi:TonB family protein